MILPSHRGAGLGHRLHDAVADDVDVLIALTMADASRRLAEKHGCVTLAEVHQLTRWVRLDPCNRSALSDCSARPTIARANVVGARLVQRVSVPPAPPSSHQPALRLRDFVERSLRRPGPTSIIEIDRFGTEIDELWERTRGDYPVIFPRDAQFLNWRFVDCPEPRYRRFVASAMAEPWATSSSGAPSPSNCRTESLSTCTPPAATRRPLTNSSATVSRSSERCLRGGLWHLGRRIRGRATQSRLLQEPGLIIRPASAGTALSVIVSHS